MYASVPDVHRKVAIILCHRVTLTILYPTFFLKLSRAKSSSFSGEKSFLQKDSIVYLIRF